VGVGGISHQTRAPRSLLHSVTGVSVQAGSCQIKEKEPLAYEARPEQSPGFGEREYPLTITGLPLLLF
jgi:hypothetical protein